MSCTLIEPVDSHNISGKSYPTPNQENPIVPPHIVKKVLKIMDPMFEIKTCSVTPMTNPGDNYMSLLFSVSAKGYVKGRARKPRNLNFLFKSLPENEGTRNMLKECLAFVKETEMYTKVLPDLMEHSRMSLDVPRCFDTFNDGLSDYLALDDLRLQGYKMADRQLGLNMKECKTALKQLAKFHALSYKRFDGDFGRIISKYPFLHNHERVFVPASQVTDMKLAYVRQTGRSYSDALISTGYLKEAQIIENFLVKKPEEVLARLHTMVTSHVKHSIIGHGDYWSNNLLFKYADSEQDHERNPITMQFIDYQMARVGSRAIDLHLFLQTSPEDYLQKNCENELLRTYHSEFTSILNSLGLHKDELSFEQLNEEFQEYRYAGICMGLFYIQFVYAKSGDIPDIETLHGTADEIMYQLFRPLVNPVTLNKVLNVISNQLPTLENNDLLLNAN